MIENRSSGILAHISSLPSPYGIGDIGTSSYAFIDFLVDCGQSHWQFLPTGPTSGVFDDSPYMSTSTFAGCPLFISPQLLFPEGLIARTELDNKPDFSPYHTDFNAVRRYKESLLRLAFSRFNGDVATEYNHFLKKATWLDAYALFMTLKELCGNTGWFAWPRQLATGEPLALRTILAKHADKIDYFRFEQFEFFRQWRLLRQYANEHAIALIGDLPIYISYDSVDVWAQQKIFDLDRATLLPTKIAGVPPDYFSKTGQRWGNPLYAWQNPDTDVQDELQSWWSDRLSHLFQLVDMTRIDHFRGFESYWAIPEKNETAIEGEWLKGPGTVFFHALTKRLGPLNIIAEDLGIITPEVEALRDELGFPGMKVLQFAFDGNKDNSFLPCNFKSPHCIVYTGTHDNDTTVGWYLSENMDDTCRAIIKRTANRTLHDPNSIHRDLIYLAQSSIAVLCIFPLQDVLGFGSDCRMNTPGVAKGNWRWRCAGEFLTAEVAQWLKSTTDLFGRERRVKTAQPAI